MLKNVSNESIPSSSSFLEPFKASGYAFSSFHISLKSLTSSKRSALSLPVSSSWRKLMRSSRWRALRLHARTSLKSAKMWPNYSLYTAISFLLLFRLTSYNPSISFSIRSTCCVNLSSTLSASVNATKVWPSYITASLL